MQGCLSALTGGMHLTYDKQADAAYIFLRVIERGGAVHTLPTEDATIMLDFDDKQRLIGIEVLDASNRLPAECLAAASVIG